MRGANFYPEAFQCVEVGEYGTATELATAGAGDGEAAGAIQQRSEQKQNGAGADCSDGINAPEVQAFGRVQIKIVAMPADVDAQASKDLGHAVDLGDSWCGRNGNRFARQQARAHRGYRRIFCPAYVGDTVEFFPAVDDVGSHT